MIEAFANLGGVSPAFVALLCLLAWASGALFGWSVRELCNWLGKLKLGRRRRRRSYYFSETEERRRGGGWRAPLAWASVVFIVTALAVSAVVTVESKKPPTSGSLRRHG